jgi:hypothetical protein
MGSGLSEVQQVFEGKVVEVLRRESLYQKGGRSWILVWVKGKSNPLALDANGFTGTVPRIGDRISVQATEGQYWFFGEHRSLVIKKWPEPRADFPSAPETLIQELGRLVLDELDLTEQVSSDDVHDEIMARVGDSYSPKIVGMVFGSLARKRKIHKVGRIKTRRPEAHAREITVWELTKAK